MTVTVLLADSNRVVYNVRAIHELEDGRFELAMHFSDTAIVVPAGNRLIVEIRK